MEDVARMCLPHAPLLSTPSPCLAHSTPPVLEPEARQADDASLPQQHEFWAFLRLEKQEFLTTLKQEQQEFWATLKLKQQKFLANLRLTTAPASPALLPPPLPGRSPALLRPPPLPQPAELAEVLLYSSLPGLVLCLRWPRSCSIAFWFPASPLPQLAEILLYLPLPTSICLSLRLPARCSQPGASSPLPRPFCR